LAPGGLPPRGIAPLPHWSSRKHALRRSDGRDPAARCGRGSAGDLPGMGTQRQPESNSVSHLEPRSAGVRPLFFSDRDSVMRHLTRIWARFFPNPTYYGWAIVGLGFLASALTSPGQSFVISLYLEPVMAELDLSRVEIS